MKANGKYYTAVWLDETDSSIVRVIDQRKLPFSFEICDLKSVEDAYEAISNMTVRGAPLIGAVAAYGMYLASLEITSTTAIREHFANAARYLVSCRPTAVNLAWAVNRVLAGIDDTTAGAAAESALAAAHLIFNEEKESCRQIGLNGLAVIEEISKRKPGQPVNILTHCNAGWLATIDYGTVTAPVYLAHQKGIPLNVWVDETRPRNQGARLTAWELGENGVPYTLVTDNAGGHLMQHGMVDIVLAGCDRATANGDVANKIGTYLKALAASDNNVPFYAVLPTSSIDMTISDGLKEINIEQRDPYEVTHVEGFLENEIVSVRICPENARAANYGFDVTPARLITGLITEKGVCAAKREEIAKLFPKAE